MELSIMEKAQIESKVKQLLDEYGYVPDRDTYVDVVAFAMKHRFLVGNADLEDSEDGFLLIQPRKTDEGDLKLIGVNATRPLEFKRFITAHEFAHSVLHYQEGKLYLHREHKKGKDENENDADYFAAALLMPAESFKRTYEDLVSEGIDNSEVVSKLASMYKVPLESALRRVDEVKNCG